MQRCLQLANMGLGNVAPNPLVGCVIVNDGKIIGEGFHREFGKKHAEINAIDSVEDLKSLKGAQLYVNLEPCIHQGKTPPCVDRILESGIQKVIIADSDPSEKIHRKGIEKLRSNGVEVENHVLRDEEHQLNKRFRTYHEKKRPYIILKWAQTADGFMDMDRAQSQRGQFNISNEACKRLLHKWRSEEQAIMAGTNTALNDDPSLTVRLVDGTNPLRILIDLKNKLPSNLKMFNDGYKTVLYARDKGPDRENVERVIPDPAKDVLNEILSDLYKREIQSLIVEGGRKLLTSFIKQDIWDEIRVFQSKDVLKSGLPAPKFSKDADIEIDLEGDTYFRYLNKK